MQDIAFYIDHTLLKPTAAFADIKQLSEEAIHYQFAAICIPPPLVKKARNLVNNSPVKVATVIGFPFGYSIAKAKLDETEQAIQDGADELDVVINLIALKAGAWDYLEKEMYTLLSLVRGSNRIIKVIIETGVLTEEEIIHCCSLYGQMGVDFVKTSTGYAEKGASLEVIRLMRAHLPSSVKIKASGGIRHYAFARQLLEAGADRLGCSAGVAIVAEQNILI